MPQFNNVMEIFKLLDKSNCRKCNAPTCLAFAAAVFKGQKELSQCPLLGADILQQFKPGHPSDNEDTAEGRIALAALQRKVARVDLAAAAENLQGRFSDGKLTLKILGKDFSIDAQGNLSSDIHINPWVGVPVLTYVLSGAESPIRGEWLPFRELEGGKPRNGLFVQMCEKPMKRIADTHPEFFEDLIRLFNGKPVDRHYRSDISLVLHPLPKVPLLICYWKPEDAMASSLTLFFDKSVQEYMDIGSVYSLVAGIVRMFEKLFVRHGMAGA
jgi:hypothetical protein